MYYGKCVKWMNNHGIVLLDDGRIIHVHFSQIYDVPNHRKLHDGEEVSVERLGMQNSQQAGFGIRIKGLTAFNQAALELEIQLFQFQKFSGNGEERLKLAITVRDLYRDLVQTFLKLHKTRRAERWLLDQYLRLKEESEEARSLAGKACKKKKRRKRRDGRIRQARKACHGMSNAQALWWQYQQIKDLSSLKLVKEVLLVMQEECQRQIREGRDDDEERHLRHLIEEIDRWLSVHSEVTFPTGKRE